MNGQNVSKTIDIITNMLSPYSFTTSQVDIMVRTKDKWAIFVDKSIFRDLINTLDLDYEPMSWDYNLQIGKQFFHMRVVLFTIDTMERFMLLNNLIFKSQYSMPWLHQLTLFSDLTSYPLLEEFIQRYRLGSHIVSIVDRRAPALSDKIIRVVTFTEAVDKLNIIKKFGKTLQLSTIHYFFVTCAFPWFQPFQLKPLLPSWKDAGMLHLIFPIILNHLSLFNYPNQLNIFDLVSLKLALCDYRISPINFGGEINYFIGRLLREMMCQETYLNDKLFDLMRYTFDMNVAPSVIIVKYFLYEFQNYIEFVRADEKWDSPQNGSNMLLHNTIVLAEHTDAVEIINSKTNVKFTIDGQNFDQMTFYLFGELMVNDRIAEIKLDTGYRWDSNESSVVNKFIDRSSHIQVIFVGNNETNFIENFVVSLKTISYPNESLSLKICQRMNNYKVFDNFTCNSLEFNDIFIDTELLCNLNQSNISNINRIKFISCTWENNVKNWQLYYSNEKISALDIQEDESTWQYLFEFIADRLFNLEGEVNVFKFERDLGIRFDNMHIRLNTLAFRLDKFKTKLQLFHEDSQTIDLYNLKHRLAYDIDKCNFDFYQ